MMRSIERDRPLPAWLAALSRRSRRLADLERRLRSAHARLGASTAGVIGPAPQGLAARTLAALPQRPRASARARPIRRSWPGLTLGVVGMVAAAAAVAVFITLAYTPSEVGPPAGPGGAIAGANVPEAAEGAPATLVTVLRTPDEVTASLFTDGLVTEAQRLRDDTKAAADFVLSRLRILGAAPRQTGG